MRINASTITLGPLQKRERERERERRKGKPEAQKVRTWIHGLFLFHFRPRVPFYHFLAPSRCLLHVHLSCEQLKIDQGALSESVNCFTSTRDCMAQLGQLWIVREFLSLTFSLQVNGNFLVLFPPRTQFNLCHCNRAGKGCHKILVIPVGPCRSPGMIFASERSIKVPLDATRCESCDTRVTSNFGHSLCCVLGWPWCPSEWDEKGWKITLTWLPLGKFCLSVRVHFTSTGKNEGAERRKGQHQ